MRKWTTLLLVAALASTAYCAGDAQLDTQQSQIEALQKRVEQLESQLTQEATQQRYAEVMRQVLSEAGTSQFGQAQDTGLTAGYDKRFFIKSNDDQFRFGIDTILQFRHSYAESDDGDGKLDSEGQRVVGDDGVDPSASAAELERARIKFSGHVMDNLNYMIQLEMDDDSEDDVKLIDYVLSYSEMPELGIKVGRYIGAFGRQYQSDVGKMMMIDYSLANSVFNIGRNTGVELFGNIEPVSDKIYYRLGVYNGFRDIGSRPFADNDNNPAGAMRIAVPLLGATPADFANESDLQGHENPVMQIGGSVAYANTTSEDNFAGGIDDNYTVLVRNADGRSDTVSPSGEVTMIGLDAAFKSNGLSLLAEGFYQHASLDGDTAFTNDFGSARDLIGIDGLDVDNTGWHAQAGYFIVPKKLELVSRVGGVHIDNSNDSYEFAGGWNYYFYGQDLKLSMDLTYIDDLPITSSATNFDGVQNNSLMLLRTQLQFQF